jgi:putative SOS response-associated peptidase YedK
VHLKLQYAMCGRFAIANSRFTRLERVLETPLPAVAPHYNIAPTQAIAVVRPTASGHYELELMRWGLIPAWAKELPRYSTFNARAETAHDKPAFSGFYEWHAMGGRKQAYYLTSSDGEELVFAGLWDEWHSPAGERLLSCTILVGPANTFIAPLHDRMPIILPEEAFHTWLAPQTPLELLCQLLVPCAPQALRGWPVSPAVNQVRNDFPELLRPLPEAPPLVSP